MKSNDLATSGELNTSVSEAIAATEQTQAIQSADKPFSAQKLVNKLDEPAATCGEPAGDAARGPRRAAAGGGREEERVEPAEAGGRGA